MISARRTRRFATVVLAILGPVVLLCCVREGQGERAVGRITRPMMGTLVEVLWRETGGTEDAAAKVRAAMDRMEVLVDRMNLYSKDSEISRVNAAAGERPVKVSPEVMEVVGRALEVSALTGGAFDPTVGSVEVVWGDFQKEGGKGKVPTEETLREAMNKVGYRGIRRDFTSNTVFLQRKGARLDLGGIAKGYIIDQGVKGLRDEGLSCVMINAGGDIRASGCRKSPPWRVGLQDPSKKGCLLGLFRVRDRAVVTSGSYERYFENEKGRFSHILDPRTGQPARGPVSVTVVAGEAALADALATAFMVIGRKGSMEVIRKLPSVQAVFVEQDGSIWIDERLRHRFQPAELSSGMQIRYYSVPNVPAEDPEP